METLILAIWDHTTHRWHTLREEPEAGYSTETVLVTALLVIMAIAVLAIIATKVRDKANDIDLSLLASQISTHIGGLL